MSRHLMKTYFKTIDFDTGQNNLLKLEPKLAPYVQGADLFYLIDITQNCSAWVEESQIRNGTMTLQVLHTTCLLSMNELDEPCLLGDINHYLRETLPRDKPYLHNNNSIRTANLCEDDFQCDRNADAHLKTFLFGSPTQSMIVHEGKPVFGRWQKLCLIDFDGPRKRKVAVQILGE